MNIKRAKNEIKNALKAYLATDEFGAYRIPPIRQRPILLMGPPGIGKTQIMQQIAEETGVGLVSYTLTHHTRQSALGLPFIDKVMLGGEERTVTAYTMSEIIASVYREMERTGVKEGILFLDEINCISETLTPMMLQFLQCKTFGNQAVPAGWVYRHVRLPPRDVVQGDRPAPVGTRTGRIARTVAVAGKRVPHPCRYLRRRDDRHRHAGGFGEGGRILKIKNEKLRIGNQGGGFGRTTVARSHAKPDPDFNPRLSTVNSRLMNTTFIAGPCVIESAELLDTVAARLTEINRRLGVQIIFKASFDKANRTSIRSYRGVGMEKGLQMLADVRSKWGLRLLTDIHESWQAAPVGEVVDVIQIPAFLCRQTDLLVAAAKTGRTVNIKKAQFLSGEDMRYPYEKACDAGAADVWLTERGNSFGYNNLVVDFRNIPDMLRIAPTVVMDCTHSVQRPGAAGGKTGGNREFVPAMALAAKAFGANGYFFEVHPDPDHALSDGPNMLNLNDLEGVVKSLL